VKISVSLGEDLFITVESKDGIPPDIVNFLAEMTQYFIHETLTAKMDSNIVSTNMQVQDSN
jgi:hypothetical protein